MSAQTVFYRLKDMGAIPDPVSRELESIYRTRAASQKPPSTTSSGKWKMARKVTQRYKYGDLYARVVLNAKQAGAVGELDVADMLELRVNWHRELAELVFPGTPV